jgi:RNA polymerase sigma factor (TIGR02999 family)
MSQPGDVTQLLRQADRGDREAADRLFRLVEDDLKAIARKRKRHAPAAGDASTTLLVDEVFCRLVGRDATCWESGDRRKFFGYASTQLHELLIKTARAERAAKRGGGRQRVSQEEVEAPAPGDAAGDLGLLMDLKSALDRFEKFAPDDALLFRMRYFLGCTFEEVAGVLGVSATQAKRTYERARLYLENELKEYALDA